MSEEDYMPSAKPVFADHELIGLEEAAALAGETPAVFWAEANKPAGGIYPHWFGWPDESRQYMKVEPPEKAGGKGLDRRKKGRSWGWRRVPRWHKDEVLRAVEALRSRRTNQG